MKPAFVIVSLLISAVGVCRGPVAASPASDTPPNIVIILADDMGFSDLGCYGGEIETPHLDSLAHHGLRFTQFYNTARCWPTRSSLLSGYYAQQIHRDALPGVRGGAGGVRQSWAKLLPDYLSPAGYRSYHSGKWHIDGKVLNAGFDRSLDVRNQGNYFTSNGNLIDDVPVKAPADEEGYYTTVATADHAIDCLQDHAANHADKPFFHYVAFIAPHFPLHALLKTSQSIATLISTVGARCENRDSHVKKSWASPRRRWHRSNPILVHHTHFPMRWKNSVLTKSIVPCRGTN